MSQGRDDIVRNDDGTIDIRFYARRAMALRRAARAALVKRALAAIGRACVALPRLLSSRRTGKGGRPRLVPSDPA